MTAALPFRTGAASHVGMLRTMNEDSFVVGDGIFAVADGMGGHLAGEVASAMAIDALRGLDGTSTVDTVVGAVITANDKILDMSRTDASRRGMGTTLTALAIVHAEDGDELAIVNLGDSRTYRFRSGRLEQITVDHSYVQELVAGGHLTADEARTHPQRNIVTRALGIEPRVGIDVWNTPLVRGDRYLLCSDGLVDEVADEYIAEVLDQIEDPQKAADQLVDMANRSGGRDNVTVVVVDILEGADVPGEPATTPVPILDDTLVTPRELIDEETGERLAGIDVHSEQGSALDPRAEPSSEGVASERGDDTPPVPLEAPPAVADTVTATDPATTDPATADTVTLAAVAPVAEMPAPARRRVGLKIVGGLAALGIIGGIIFIAARDEGSSPDPTTTTVPATTTTVPAATTAPVTTIPTTAVATTTTGA